MPKVTIKEDVKEATEQAQELSNVLKDAKGRQIVLRELDPLQESRIFIAVGAANAANHTYMSGYAFPAAMVESIDDVEYQIPVNQAQIDGRLKHLGREGMLAIREYMLKALEESGLNSGEDEVEQAAKN